MVMVTVMVMDTGTLMVMVTHMVIHMVMVTIIMDANAELMSLPLTSQLLFMSIMMVLLLVPMMEPIELSLRTTSSMTTFRSRIISISILLKLWVTMPIAQRESKKLITQQKRIDQRATTLPTDGYNGTLKKC